MDERDGRCTIMPFSQSPIIERKCQRLSRFTSSLLSVAANIEPTTRQGGGGTGPVRIVSLGLLGGFLMHCSGLVLLGRSEPIDTISKMR